MALVHDEGSIGKCFKPEKTCEWRELQLCARKKKSNGGMSSDRSSHSTLPPYPKMYYPNQSLRTLRPPAV
ncbi:hypothetical protein TNCV_3881831 [Trichonephila clavipes]|nr:hypothetical protein TNCV_3881831 [Trichonephila clavipes]